MDITPHIVVLAAGKGRRMKSELPKVLHPVLGKPMLHYVLDAAKGIPYRSLCVVVGHGEELVRSQCAQYPEVRFFRQDQQLGTAHAVGAAEPLLREAQGTALVLSGDVVLVKPESLRRLLETHARSGAACTMATACLADPRGYGRVLVDGGRVLEVREDADCGEAERAIREVNAGVYCFETGALLDALKRVENRNAQGEYYLPDVVRILAAQRRVVARFSFEDPTEMLGINDLYAHWEVETLLRERLNREWMLAGVRLCDPRTTTIDPRCRLAPGACIEGGVTLIDSSVGAGSVVESGSRLVGCEVAEGVHVKQGSYLENSQVSAGCVIGPYAHLRPGTRLDRDVKIGNFVEVKNSVLGQGSQASHLSYIGDAEIGRRVNLGCGFITCNFDGRRKNRTVIGDDAFVGSDSQTVAPVRVGAGSFVATGTTVTEDVPEDALVLSRGRQVVKEGYAKKYRA